MKSRFGQILITWLWQHTICTGIYLWHVIFPFSKYRHFFIHKHMIRQKEKKSLSYIPTPKVCKLTFTALTSSPRRGRARKYFWGEMAPIPHAALLLVIFVLTATHYTLIKGSPKFDSHIVFLSKLTFGWSQLTLNDLWSLQ